MLEVLGSIKYVFVYASTYGSGNYGAGVYQGEGELGEVPTTGGTPPTSGINEPIFTIGGLPVTGSTLLEIAAGLAIATAVGLVVWAHGRRKAAKTSDTTQ